MRKIILITLFAAMSLLYATDSSAQYYDATGRWKSSSGNTFYIEDQGYDGMYLTNQKTGYKWFAVWQRDNYYFWEESGVDTYGNSAYTSYSYLIMDSNNIKITQNNGNVFYWTRLVE